MNTQTATNILEEQIALQPATGHGVKVTFQRPLDLADQLVIEDHFASTVPMPLIFNWTEATSVVITKL